MPKDHRGQPSGSNKSEGTGVPSNTDNEDLRQDDEITEKYTEDDSSVAENIRQNHPNRNVSKDEATNNGGYHN